MARGDFEPPPVRLYIAAGATVLFSILMFVAFITDNQGLGWAMFALTSSAFFSALMASRQLNKKD